MMAAAEVVEAGVVEVVVVVGKGVVVGASGWENKKKVQPQTNDGVGER